MQDDPGEIAIVGAGFAGLCMAIELREAGIEDFTIYEAADSLGGTWRDNTYPGCGCDIPSHLYAYSFEPNPDWSRIYSRQPEILEYLKEVAADHDLYGSIEFGTDVTGAEFERGPGRWRLETADGATMQADHVVLGVGPLSRPFIPDIDGLADFEGPTMHSARWDHHADLEGKRVAVVGTGASAIQLVPGIAERVDQLYVFQRTAPWVVPRGDRAYTDVEKWAFDAIPGLQWAYRKALYWLFEARATGFVSEPRIMEALEWFARWYIDDCFDDPAMKEKVTPDYTMGCKRILLSDNYYPALAREDVELISGEVGGFGPETIRTSDGREREIDAVAFATGFRVTDFLSDFDIRGLDGRTLREAWSDGAEAYYGVSVAGFPNLHILLGPNTGLGHNSVVFMIEAQTRMIRRALEALGRRGASYMDVRASVHRAHNEAIQERMRDTVWKSGCESWYLDEEGKNTTLWPGYTFEYWWKTRDFDASEYRFVW